MFSTDRHSGGERKEGRKRNAGKGHEEQSPWKKFGEERGKNQHKLASKLAPSGSANSAVCSSRSFFKLLSLADIDAAYAKSPPKNSRKTVQRHTDSDLEVEAEL